MRFSARLVAALVVVACAAALVDAWEPTQKPTPIPVKCVCRKDVRCFVDAAHCFAGKPGVTLGAGDRSQCKNQPVYYTVFDCWEDVKNGVGECRNLWTCRPIPDGHGNQDPHFKGFDNSDYYFEGKAGSDYNIISDVNFQLNARFIQLKALKGTYMGRLGFRFGEHSLMFDSYFGVFFNGTVYTGGSVELPAGSFTVQPIGTSGYDLVLQTETYEIHARTVIEDSNRAESYINLGVNLIGTPLNPHGVLGQTARVAHGESKIALDLTESQYLVQDGLFGTDFPVNRFDAKAAASQPISAVGRRVGRAVETRFAASVDA